MQEEYAKEKLAWKRIEFADNTDCLDLIDKKPNGIMQILDDESNFPKVNDSDQKVRAVHTWDRAHVDDVHV